jgi:hypothetical protein
VSNLSQTLGGPTFAAGMDLLEALRLDNASRAEIEQLVTYLLDSASANEAQAGVLAAALDMLQLLQDDTNLQPFDQILARIVSPPVTDANGNIVQRSLADTGLRSIVKILELDTEGTGASTCSYQRDPNRVISYLLQNLVTPMASNQLPPLDTIMNTIGDVNRANPSLTTKLNGDDYGNINNEMSEFCLDPTRGLEQFYAVIKQVTGG